MNETANLPATTVKKGTLSQRAMASAMFSLPAGYEVAKIVTRSVLPQEDGIPFYAKFEGAIYTGEELKPQGRGAKMSPAQMAEIINLETNEPCLLIMNKVLESEINKAYPDAGYVGKSFAIVRGAHPDARNVDGTENLDKRYKLYRILELKHADGGELKSAGNGVIDGTSKEAVDRAKASHLNKAVNK